MLRIRTHYGMNETRLVVEGRLSGPWIDELARCWANVRNTYAGPIRVDLDGVTFVGAAGKALLAQLHDEGALLTARACMTRALIEEVANLRPEQEESSQ
jgi:ABC-type transporter Mla MlaB component